MTTSTQTNATPISSESTNRASFTGDTAAAQSGNAAVRSPMSEPMNLNDWERIGSILIGALGLFLLSRRLIVYLAMAAASGYLIYRGLTGFCLLYNKANVDTRHATLADAVHKYRDNRATRQWMERPHDPVEEASWQSFPASDPPGTY